MNQEKLIEKLIAQRDALFIIAIVASLLAGVACGIAYSYISFGCAQTYMRGDIVHADVKI